MPYVGGTAERIRSEFAEYPSALACASGGRRAPARHRSRCWSGYGRRCRCRRFPAPPDGIEASGSTQAPPSDQLFVYPKNGQSSEQQSKDDYECHRWAVDQTGFDPTEAGGGVAPEQAVNKRNDYFRAKVSCLEGRGYTVR